MASFSWELDASARGPVFRLAGCIDERADLQPLAAHISEIVLFDFALVERFNSSGIMRWFDFFESIRHQVREIHFTRCSVSVVNHLNMIRNFAPGVWIDSFFAPYFCEVCGQGEDHLIEIASCQTQLLAYEAPSSTCSGCGQPMLFDSLEATYFTFLHEKSLRFPQGEA